MRFAPIATLMTLCAAVAILPAGCTSSQEEDRPTREQNKVTGTVSTLVSAPLDRAFSAALSAVEGLQFTTTRQTKDALKGQIAARTADDKTVNISLTRKSDSITEISVSAGPLNQSLADTVARRIQDKIR